MPKILTLTTPIEKPSTKVWTLGHFISDFASLAIRFHLTGDNGESLDAVYPTPPILNPNGVLQASGQQLISTLVTFNFSAGADMETIIYTFLQNDGYLGAGVISGNP